MVLVTDQFEYVVGIDTHARTHTYCLIRAQDGAVISTATFPTSSAGNARAVNWIGRRSQHTAVLAAAEGTSSYGSSITAALDAAGITVAEVRPAARSTHAHSGKSDVLDAEAAARAVLGRDTAVLCQPRQAGSRTALRVLLAARAQLDHHRTANRNALNALARSVDIGIDARKPLNDAQIKTISAWRTSGDNGPARIFRTEAKRLARAILEHIEQLKVNHLLLAELTEELAPGLQQISGVGPVTGAILVTAYSHRGRVRSEAAFAALGGIAPLPASSGNTTRHRLSRSGDRQLNRAVDTIVRTRMSYNEATREYVSRRRAEGRTPREVRRCLRRYVCRAMFRELQTRMA